MSKIQSYAHHKDMDRTGGVSDVSDLIKYLDDFDKVLKNV